MNHRTGRLTWRDFEPQESQPAPTFFTGPIETTTDFAVLNPGRTFHEPSRRQGVPPKDRLGDQLFAIAFGVALAALAFFGLSS